MASSELRLDTQADQSRFRPTPACKFTERVEGLTEKSFIFFFSFTLCLRLYVHCKMRNFTLYFDLACKFLEVTVT